MSANLSQFRIATWNLDYVSPVGHLGIRCIDQIKAIRANIWILTEVRADFEVPGYHLVGHTESMLVDKRQAYWVSIWVDNSLGKYELQQNLSDPEYATCLKFTLPNYKVLFVYGTVLPWVGSPWKDFPAEEGQAFRAALNTQQRDWLFLKDQQHDAIRCVAGDFNQDLLVDEHFYGSKGGCKALRLALEESDLECFTGGERDPVRLLSPGYANIDHICLGGINQEVASRVRTNAWFPYQKQAKYWDHFGVLIDFPLA